MKNFILIFMVVFTLSPIKSFSDGGVYPTNKVKAVLEVGATFNGRVTYVTDGDTFKIKVPDLNKIFNVRIFGVDAPELKQDYGVESRNYLNSLIGNKDVSITIIGVDDHGRLLSKVYVDDFYINNDIVKSGNAWWYSYFAKNEIDLKESESYAKENKLGLWKKENPTSPYEYRKIQSKVVIPNLKKY